MFVPGGRHAAPITWEPPVDQLETERAVLVLAALPGVDASKVNAAIENGQLVISGQRVLPPELRTATIHRLELPQGRFERRVSLPPGAYESVRRDEEDGCLRHHPHQSQAHRGEPEGANPMSPDDIQTPPAAMPDTIDTRGAAAAADAMIVLPVRNIVLFPEVVLPFPIRRPLSVQAAQAAVREQRQVVILLQKDPSVDAPGPDDLYQVGVVANILRYVTAQDGGSHLICQGVQRFRVTEFVPGLPYLAARGLHLPGAAGDRPRTSRRGSCCSATSRWRCWSLIPQAPAELRNAIENIQSQLSAALADLGRHLHAGHQPRLKKQDILETVDLVARLDKVSRLLAHRLEVLKLSAEIGAATKASIEGRQREVLLREQMAAIQKELGEGDAGNAAEIAELDKAIDAGRACPRRSRSRPRRSCGGCNACPTRRPSTA